MTDTIIIFIDGEHLFTGSIKDAVPRIENSLGTKSEELFDIFEYDSTFGDEFTEYFENSEPMAVSDIMELV